MDFSKIVNETRSNMYVAKSELDLYLSRHNIALSQLQAAKEALQSASTTRKERLAAIKVLESKLPQAEDELSKVRFDLKFPYVYEMHNLLNIICSRKILSSVQLCFSVLGSHVL